MKRLLLDDWAAKLITLLLAATLWFLIRKMVETTPTRNWMLSAPELREVPRSGAGP